MLLLKHIHNYMIYEIFSSLHDEIFLFFASWQVYNSIVSMVMSPFCQREGANTAENQGLSSAVCMKGQLMNFRVLKQICL